MARAGGFSACANPVPHSQRIPEFSLFLSLSCSFRTSKNPCCLSESFSPILSAGSILVAHIATLPVDLQIEHRNRLTTRMYHCSAKE
jgi:hypothetical protein